MSTVDESPPAFSGMCHHKVAHAAQRGFIELS